MGLMLFSMCMDRAGKWAMNIPHIIRVHEFSQSSIFRSKAFVYWNGTYIYVFQLAILDFILTSDFKP